MKDDAAKVELDAARGIEHAASLARQLRSALSGSGWRRARRRARRQLRRLEHTLEIVQAQAITGHATPSIAAIQLILEGALHTRPRKAWLKQLRRAVKAERKSIQAALAAPPPAAHPDDELLALPDVAS